jgi:hypothetical protein
MGCSGSGYCGSNGTKRFSWIGTAAMKGGHEGRQFRYHLGVERAAA